MKTQKWTEPTLLADDHHGVYMMHLWAKQQKAENSFVWGQIQAKMDADSIDSLLAGPDDEWHFESCDELTGLEFKTPTGQKFTVQYAEGGLWAIPACFKGKKAEEFFGV